MDTSVAESPSSCVNLTRRSESLKICSMAPVELGAAVSVHSMWNMQGGIGIVPLRFLIIIVLSPAPFSHRIMERIMFPHKSGLK